MLVTEADYEEIDNFLFIEEQNAIARSLHMIDCEDLKVEWKLLKLFFQKFEAGGIKRQRYTYPAAFFAMAKLMRKSAKANLDVRREINLLIIYL